MIVYKHSDISATITNDLEIVADSDYTRVIGEIALERARVVELKSSYIPDIMGVISEILAEMADEVIYDPPEIDPTVVY